jgi:hypothetical protein
MANPTMDKLLSVVQEYYHFPNPRARHISMFDFKRTYIYKISPVFFLSTGRCGTLWFTKLMENVKEAAAFHNPSPPLVEQSKSVYECRAKEKGSALLEGELFLAARENLLRQAYHHDKVYIETNNRISFLAYGILEKIPNARFIHLYRNPFSFIRSGVNRGWYSGHSKHDLGRIEPVIGDQYYNRWVKMSQLEKIAWLWKETNQFILDFVKVLQSEAFFTYNFDENSPEKLRELFDFLDFNYKSSYDLRIGKAVNIQKKISIPSYEKWSKEEKISVREIVEEIASGLGYNVE